MKHGHIPVLYKVKADTNWTIRFTILFLKHKYSTPMIVCSSCGSEFIKSPTLANPYCCPTCGSAPQRIDGFFSWAPELAVENEHFPSKSFEDLFEQEAGSFWFRSRNAVILWALGKFCSDFTSLLEIGCGTGFVSRAIKDKYPLAQIQGTEVHLRGLSYAQIRLPDIDLMQLDAQKLPYKNEYDVVAAFDVIEHITDDELVLQNIYHALKVNGFCVITVPQHMWLWSAVDQEACHKRRYSATELRSKLTRAGFQIVKSISFVSLLVPLMLAARRATTRNRRKSAALGLGLNTLLDKVLALVMDIELILIKLGVSFPIGGSRLVVARKVERL
jgi:SAM-dependent methyltransferase